jgi:cobalamin synthase
LTERTAESSLKELRDFGLIVGGLFAAIFGLLLPILKHRSVPIWPWVVCFALVVAALAWPAALRWPHYLWTRLGLVLGRINQWIILTVVFYMIVVPTGLIMRLCGRDPMSHRFERDRDSYSVPSRGKSPGSMDRPY